MAGNCGEPFAVQALTFRQRGINAAWMAWNASHRPFLESGLPISLG